MARIDLNCRGCGRVGRVRERCAGPRVDCKLCGAVNRAPGPVTREIYVALWLAEIDALASAATVEVDTRTWSRAV